MAKATLTFNLPEERSEYFTAVHAGNWKSIVFELSMFLRNKIKYGHNFKTADEALQAIKTELWHQCESNKIDPWED